MTEQTERKLVELTEEANAKVAACHFMLKILLYLHFSDQPDSAAQAADFRKKVLDFAKREFKFPKNQSFEKKLYKEIETLLSSELFDESSFNNLVSDLAS